MDVVIDRPLTHPLTRPNNTLITPTHSHSDLSFQIEADGCGDRSSINTPSDTP